MENDYDFPLYTRKRGYMSDYTSEYFVYAMRALSWLFPLCHPFHKAATRAYREYEENDGLIEVNTDHILLKATPFQTEITMRAKRNNKKYTFCLKPSVSGYYTLENYNNGTDFHELNAREVVDCIQYTLR